MSWAGLFKDWEEKAQGKHREERQIVVFMQYLSAEPENGELKDYLYSPEADWNKINMFVCLLRNFQ